MSSSSLSLTQSYFDETVVENEEVFDLSANDAVVETMDQLFKQQQQAAAGTGTAITLKQWREHQEEQGVSLTHPESKQGLQDRQDQRVFQSLLDAEEWNNQEGHLQKILDMLQRDRTRRANDDDGAKEEEAEARPVLVGPLFWRTTSNQDENKMQAKNGNNSNNANALFKLAHCVNNSNDIDEDFLLSLRIALLALSTGPPALRRTRQEQMLREFVMPSQGWQRLFGTSLGLVEHQVLWLQIIYQVCQGNEPNKKYCNSKPILQILVSALENQQQLLLPADEKDNYNTNIDTELAEATCRVLTVLCRFDDFSSQATQGQATDNTGMVVSSAHSTVTALGNMGIVPTVHAWLLFVANQQDQQQQPSLLLALLQCLRSLAIQNEMVVQMTSVGLLEVLQSIFERYCSSSSNDGDDNKTETLRLDILTALIGLYRNMSANDELKTTLCRSPQKSIVGPLIATLQSLTQQQQSTGANRNSSNSSLRSATLTKLQEHVCATLGSMALRQPQNAQKIVEDYHGHLVILKAMEMSQHSALVQRQGALAMRNLASRSSDATRQALLDAGAEPVLRQAATLGAVDEAYAALRDLGCHAVLQQFNPDTGELERQPMFGEKPIQFRPVYD